MSEFITVNIPVEIPLCYITQVFENEMENQKYNGEPETVAELEIMVALFNAARQEQCLKL